MRLATGLGLLALTGTLAGCAGAGPGATRPQVGAALFAQDCSVCHSLSGNNSPSRQGGDLLGYRFSRAVMLEFAREMPIRRPLSSAELGVLTDYIVQAERNGHAH